MDPKPKTCPRCGEYALILTAHDAGDCQACGEAVKLPEERPEPDYEGILEDRAYARGGGEYGRLEPWS